MPSILVTYYSCTGHTQELAEPIAKGAELAGATVALKPVGDVDVDALAGYDAIIIGSPNYYGCMAAPVKALLDASVKLHGKLRGKVGGAFCSSARLSGGNETTVISILQALLVHGMIVVGGTPAFPYGPTAVHKPEDSATRQECEAYGKLIAEVAKKLG